MEKLWMPAGDCVMYPPFLIPPQELYLENFAWFDYVRPLDKEDIFNWRPKKAGTELKETVRRTAPKQTLDDVRQKNQKKNRKERKKDGNVSDTGTP
jgi:hypothetical protein